VYSQLVADGFPAGVAADDDVALHYVGTELREVITTRAGATAYRVTPDGEEPLDAKLLG
jgi:dipeptidase E